MIQDHLSAFERNYEAEVLGELPSSKARVLYYPGASDRGGRDGLLLAIVPHNADEWIGVFAFGGFGGSITAITSTPSRDSLCVVSKGAAYLVNVRQPEKWSEVPIVPVTYLQPLPEKGIIVLADHIRIGALGKDGLIWRTRDLSWDGILISQIGPEYIEGEGWNPTTTIRPAFRVNLATGDATGGSSPESVEQRQAPLK